MELELVIEEFITNYGIISIFIIVALEYANFPLPSEVVLPFAGIFAYEYNMGFINVLIVSVVGGVLGSLINYYLGLKFGKPFIDLIIDKFPKTKKSVKSSYSWIKKYDKLSILISRLVPLARTFISIVAGVIKMNVVAFTIYSTIGIVIWNTCLILMGYLVGDNLDIIKLILTRYSYLIIVLLLITLIGYLIIKRKKKKV